LRAKLIKASNDTDFRALVIFKKLGKLVIGNFGRNLTSQGGSSSDVTTKRLGGATILTLNEQQYSVWYTASQSIKQPDMLDVLRWAWPPSLPWLRL